jgi:riboflavin synthase
MFTGIITDIGQVTAISTQADPVYTITTRFDVKLIALGASIACNGVCLTVIARAESHFQVQVSAETLAKTTVSGWQLGTKINLERPMQAGDEFGGHMVSGHVDGVAEIMARQAEGDSLRFTVRAPQELQKFLAPKGSVTLDGVSLTVNEVMADSFGVNIIPHTQQETIFGLLQAGDKVNIEIDMMARYLDRLLQQRGL